MRSLGSVLAMLLATAVAVAQEKLVVEQPEPATIRLGDSAQVRIRIEGRAADPRTPTLPEVPGLQLELSAPSRSSYTFYDGRRLIEQVGVQYVLELHPTRAGTFDVPPFAIWTGSREQRTPSLRLEVHQDLKGAELGWLQVEVEPRRVYVHEPVRVSVSAGIQQGLSLVQNFADRYRYLDLEVQAAWLDEFPGGERLDVADPVGDTRATVCNRRLVRSSFDGSFDHEGKTWQRFSFERAFLPTRLGKLELAAPMLRFNLLRRSGRQDILGRMRGQVSENYYVYGEPVELEVLPIPEEGRPTPYFGAVGRFVVEASLGDREVQVGDSLKLTLVVRGRGNFEFLRMPELDELEGFHMLGSAEVERDANRVVVTYDLTPLSTDVTQIPPIRWNYFDTTPGVEKFVEVATEPLALTVTAIADGEGLAPLPDEVEAAVTPGVDDIFDLPDFEGPPRRAQPTAVWLRWLGVCLPWVLVLLAFFGLRARRRAAADVVGQRVRGARRRFDEAMQADSDPLDAFVAYLGDRLDVPAAALISVDVAERLVDSGLDGEVARRIAAAIERGTAGRYGGGQPMPETEARELVSQLEEQRFGARSWLPLLLLPMLCVLADDVSAQRDPAIAAYRKGDYRTAERAFARAYAETGDRRHLRAQGNCLFRLGDLPRAHWAYESARLAMPRDAELLANLRLVRARLELPEPEPGFTAELQRLLRRMTSTERLAACAAAMLLAALCLVFGWRRLALRWLGFAALLPAGWLALAILWWLPEQNRTAVALRELAVTAEPRAGMDAIANVRAGVLVDYLGGSQGDFVRVHVGEHQGYVPSDQVAIVE